MTQDARSRKLYEQQRQQTQESLLILANESRFANFKDALCDPRLVEGFEAIVEPYVLFGVKRDLFRLEQCNALFEADNQAPALYEVLPLAGCPATYAKPRDPGVRGNEAKKKEGYQNYFERYIDPQNVEQTKGSFISGVDAFYRRYPLILHAVQKVTQNYTGNIRLACERIFKNWNDIDRAFFFPSDCSIKQLRRIQTTGNDFHKGGKQVLILHFTRHDTRAHGPSKVVYKPSAVEVDCRIVGKSSTVNAIKPDRYIQPVSLSELINQSCASADLPTYRILPYNSGSVPDAYGYLEFITHWPAPSSRIEFGNELDVPPASVSLCRLYLTRRLTEAIGLSEEVMQCKTVPTQSRPSIAHMEA